MRYLIQLGLVAALTSGCAINRGKAASPESLPESDGVASAIEQGLSEEVVKADAKISSAKEAVTEEEPTAVSSHPGVLIEVNKSVEKWIAHFSGKARDTFTRFLERGAEYKTMVQEILKEHGVPEEFYYLAMIESGYVTHATSNQSAVGIWQFVRGTSQRYGLKSDRFVDERRDPIRATRAAAQYLTDLHNIFGSWHLALCAYNAGEGRIMRAIMRGKSRDFWTLVEKKVLPRETNDYVPIFLAATIIGNNPEKYGFEAPTKKGRPAVAGVLVPSPVRLASVAKAARVSLPELKAYNPNLLKEVTPPGSKPYKVWLPAEKAPVLARSLSSLSLVRYERPASPQRGKYRVKSGDTLIDIAERFGLSLSGLKKLNRLSRNRIQAGQVLRVGART
jgi:membrane-bound lytic murein transglycosylase D